MKQEEGIKRKEEEEKRFKEQQEAQRRLFEQSTEEARKEEMNRDEKEKSTEDKDTTSDQEALMACMKAQTLAKKYIQDTGKPEFMNEIYNLFKIMLIPEEALINSFIVQGSDAMASAY